MAHQNHACQADLLPPLFDRVDKLVFGHDRIAAKLRP